MEAAALQRSGSWLSRLTTAPALPPQVEAAALQRILDALDQNKPARAVELNDDEAAAVKSLYLLTMKPLIYAANVAEDMLADLGATDKHVQVRVLCHCAADDASACSALSDALADLGPPARHV